MKILYAKQHPEQLKEYQTQLFNVNELIIIPADDWLIKRMKQFEYDTSFKNNGMIYPITVSTHEHDWVKERLTRKSLPHIDEQGNVKPGLYVHTGNKRVLWARENGYEQIEGYLVSSKETKAIIRSKTHIGHESIPK